MAIPTNGRHIKLLAFAEAVTLAHVARPAALLGQLDGQRYQRILACDPRYGRFIADGPWQTATLVSQSSDEFLRALARGTAVHSLQRLQAQVQEDLALIAFHRPDLVLGDFRLSLSVSARISGVPYLSITNAYWSPASPQPYVMPVLPMTRCLPLGLASALFHAVGPVVMAAHCRPLNRLRKLHGLDSLGSDLRRIYTDADRVLVADAPAVFPIEPLPSNHVYVGPLLWSPPVALPQWWAQLRDDQPSVYVALGSSGSARLLPTLLAALAALPVQVLVSTAGAPAPTQVPANARLAAYLPGDQAAARSSLVICNGGSMAVQQALSFGVPVLGIPGNMDQFMNMAAVERIGAGVALRADRVDPEALRILCARLLSSSELASAAQAARLLQQMPQSAAEVFDAAAQDLLGPRRRH